MKAFPVLILTFGFGMLVLASASADTPPVAPGGDDPQAEIDLSNASVDEAPIVIAGTPRRTVEPKIACCNHDRTCQTTSADRCTIQGGTPAIQGCTVSPPAVDDEACPAE
jgi:hypothetical protein